VLFRKKHGKNLRLALPALNNAGFAGSFIALASLAAEGA
jgi:hypothetical protein